MERTAKKSRATPKRLKPLPPKLPPQTKPKPKQKKRTGDAVQRTAPRSTHRHSPRTLWFDH